MKLLMIFEISTAIIGFWVMLLCSFLCGYRHCGVIALSILPTLKMVVRYVSEILIITCETTCQEVIASRSLLIHFLFIINKFLIAMPHFS
jgi:hypothetical protein